METESTLPAGPLMKRHNGKPGVFVEVDKRLLIPALYGLDRPDIHIFTMSGTGRPDFLCFCCISAQ